VNSSLKTNIDKNTDIKSTVRDLIGEEANIRSIQIVVDKGTDDIDRYHPFHSDEYGIEEIIRKAKEKPLSIPKYHFIRIEDSNNRIMEIDFMMKGINVIIGESMDEIMLLRQQSSITRVNEEII